MSKIVSAFKAFVADENGVTAIEYGLIAAPVGVAIVGAVTLLGGQLTPRSRRRHRNAGSYHVGASTGPRPESISKGPIMRHFALPRSAPDVDGRAGRDQ
jgi:pilus assembly protein Flp/PilA